METHNKRQAINDKGNSDTDECEYCDFDFDTVDYSDLDQCAHCKKPWCPNCIEAIENNDRGVYSPSKYCCNQCNLTYCIDCVETDIITFKKICTYDDNQLVSLGDYPVQKHDGLESHATITERCRIEQRSLYQPREIWLCPKCTIVLGYTTDSGDFVHIGENDDDV